MTGELITTGVTFGAGRNSINDAFSGTAEFNNIALDSGADFSGGTGGGVIYSGGTDLYDIFLTTASDATTASNGLIKTGDNITIGGSLTGDTEIQLSGFNISFIGGNIGINTTPSTSFDISGLTSIRGEVGSDTLSPHLEIYHNTQAQPVAQYQHWSSDNISISKGLYWDSGAWRNSDTGSNFQIYKWADAFRFNYGTGGTLGNAAIVQGGFALTNTGNLKIGGFTQLGTVTATEKVDIDGNIIIRGNATITGDTILYSTEKVRKKTVHNYGTSGGTITWDIDNSANARIILSGSITIDITNVQDGDYGTMKITQDGVGSHTLTLGVGTHNVANGGGGSITLTSTAGAIDIITFFYDGSEFNWSVGYNYN